MRKGLLGKRTAPWMAGVGAVLLLVTGCGLQSGGAVPLAVGPGSIRPDPALSGVSVTVGSKDTSEQHILAYILEFALVAAGADVRDLSNIQGSNSMRDAQVRGQVNIAYDYTGTGWMNYLGHDTPVPGERAQFEATRDADLAAHNMVWTDPAPMNNTYALATNPQTQAETGVATLSQYAQLARTNPTAANTCVDTEFDFRRDGYPGMAERYGISPNAVPKRLVQQSLVYSLVAAGQCRFGVVDVTDGRIPALGLLVLQDDWHYFPQYNAALVVRRDFADAHPQIARIIAPISALLTNQTITELNRQVDVQGQQAPVVARNWLIARGFVTAR